MRKVTLDKDKKAYLKRWYGKKTLDEIGEHIGLTAPTVKIKAIELGLHGKRVSTRITWTDEQLEYLKDNYPDMSLSDLSEHIGMSGPTIQRKALELGLKRSEEYDKSSFNRRYVKRYKHAV